MADIAEAANRLAGTKDLEVQGALNEAAARVDAVLFGFPGYVAGQYYGSAIQLGTGATQTLLLAANELRAFPVFVSKNQQLFDRVGVEVSTAVAATNIRFGLYKDNSGYPGERLLASGSVSSATTGLKEVTTSLRLAFGVVWLAVLSDGAPTLRANTQSHGLGMPVQTGTGIATNWLVSGQPFATLPTTFPAGGTLGSGNAVRPFLRAA